MEKPVSILLVDDEPKNLHVLATILESPELSLVQASSANDALTALMHQDFAAIVLDVRMPNLDGIELAQLIKQRKKTQHIPIVFLTAYDQEEEQIVMGYGAGAVDYITKPVNPAILRSKIGVFIDLFKKTKALAEMNEAMSGEIEERQKAEAALRGANKELEKRNLELQQRAEERTLRVRAEAAQAEAEAANQAKDQFLAMLSHELRTPLSPVLHAVNLLEEEENSSAFVRDVLATIRRNVQLEARLIDDLLDLAKIRNGKLQLQLEPVNIHDLLHRALEICQPPIAANHLEVALDLAAKNPWSNADPARIQQIFWNLISNAVKYTPEHGKVSISTRNEDDSVQFEIADSGIGIDADRIGTIFDAFTQAHGGRYHGLGLGLAICRALTQLHGGSISVRSEGQGNGAAFRVTLPATSEPAAHVNPALAAIPSGGGAKLRLLLVEDHADTMSTLSKLLLRRGYELRSTISVDDAMRVAGEFEFDVLISDIGLPDGTGMDLMRKLVEKYGARNFEGIALSGYGTQQDLDRTRNAGFREHLIKPIDIAHLHRTLIAIGEERALEKSRP